MAIINLMEDIVAAIVNEVLLKEDKDMLDNKTYKEDIITYVLNRVPSKYYTSERGILHGKLKSQFIFQQRVDTLLLIHEAIKVIKSRRSSEPHSDNNRIKRKAQFLPHIIGEVLEETTFSMIPDVEALLTFRGKPAKMVDLSWKNPYITNKATKGFYHFWPEFADKGMGKGSDISFQIVFNHPKFKEKKIDLALNVVKSFNFNKSHVIPIVLLPVQEGIDISFLYE